MKSFSPVYLAALGDARDPATGGGLPHHLLQAAEVENIPLNGLRFDIAQAGPNAKRLLWAAKRIAKLQRPRGFQYSPQFLNDLWATVTLPPPNSLLVNCLQIYPPSIFEDPRYGKAFYLDQTLLQLFDYYGQGARVASDVRKYALTLEKKQYEAADMIILRSRWAAESVINDYCIDPAKVHVVLPGANIDLAALDDWEANHAGECPVRSPGPLILGFVGKEWKRKGLDRLICALRLLRRAGRDIELHVIGIDPAVLPAKLRGDDYIKWLGFVDKRCEPARFVHAVSKFDIGCLLSRREAGGISLREFARLGLPTIAPNTGGSPEFTVSGATTLIPQEADEVEIAALMDRLVSAPALLDHQRAIAWQARGEADWRPAVCNMDALWTNLGISHHSAAQDTVSTAAEAREETGDI